MYSYYREEARNSEPSCLSMDDKNIIYKVIYCSIVSNNKSVDLQTFMKVSDRQSFISILSLEECMVDSNALCVKNSGFQVATVLELFEGESDLSWTTDLTSFKT